MNKVAINATWIIICRIAQAIFGLIINMFTARYLGPSNFGLITYATSLVTFVIPIMQLGFNNILVQEIVNNPDREGVTLGTSVILDLISSVCCMIGVTTFAFIVNANEPTTIIVCLLYSFILVFKSFDLLQYWYQAKLLSKYTSVISLLAYFIVSGYKVFLLITEKSVYWFAISNAFDYALISIGMIIMYRKLGGQKLRFSLSVGKAMFSRSRHYILSSMMVVVFAQTDKIMLKLMIDETATGYYGAAVACAVLSSFLFDAIIDSFRPSIFEGHKKSVEVFEHRLILLYSLVIYLSLAQSIVMTLGAKYIVLILYSDQYLSAIDALRIVVWYTTFAYIGAVRNIWILANNQQHYLWIINLLGATANIILNLILIPIYGINGAAVASLITQFFTNVIVGYIIKPIRQNNHLMIRSINPRYLLQVMGTFFKKEKNK